MNNTQENKIIKLGDFVKQFGDSLNDAVNAQVQPRFNQNTVLDQSLYQGFKRQPFVAQQRVIQATTELLKTQKAAIINADMGCGKSILGVSVAKVLHDAGHKRALVICPPHLVHKWKREILQTIDAEVIVLNGASAITKLQKIRQNLTCIGKDKPVFFIVGRVRLRLGHHWRPAYRVKRGKVACPHCDTYFSIRDDLPIVPSQFNHDKKQNCVNPKCKAPLWQLHRKGDAISSESDLARVLPKALSKLPSISRSKAQNLVDQYDSHYLLNALTDNFHEFSNLLDEGGNFVFTETQANCINLALSQTELGLASGEYQVSEFLKRYFPKNYFGLMIVDEAHEYKNISAQGLAMGVLASSVANKVLLLTGTLIGGYADDLFYLLSRIMPGVMRDAGFGYVQRKEQQTLLPSVKQFMHQHGVLQEISRNDPGASDDSFKTSNGNRSRVSIKKSPGLSPQAIMQFILPYTAFLRLDEVNDNLPGYQENLIEVDMDTTQYAKYYALKATLMKKIQAALSVGNKGLLGLHLSTLLSFPECCFNETEVVSPGSGETIFACKALYDDETLTPKEQALLDKCLQNKAAGRRTLAYTIYSDTKDTTARLVKILKKHGLKAHALKSSITTDKREAWIANKIDAGIDVLVCNPELVKTGLDLLEFPSIVFMQTGYNVFTLMQAAKRSWRIGQTEDVEVSFLSYRDAMQTQCLALMQKKIAVTQSASGIMPESGLDALESNTDSIQVQLAKQIVEGFESEASMLRKAA